jgi:hypothetical protein
MGPAGAKKIDAVCQGMLDDNPVVAVSAVTTLVMMGAAAKDAIPNLEKLPKVWDERDVDKKYWQNKEEKHKYWEELTKNAIKAIKDAKPVQ